MRAMRASSTLRLPCPTLLLTHARRALAGALAAAALGACAPDDDPVAPSTQPSAVFMGDIAVPPAVDFYVPPPDRVAYAWAHDGAATADYAPYARYSYNPFGAITIHPYGATGRYDVYFDGMGATGTHYGETVIVSAQDESRQVHCSAEWTTPDPGARLTVRVTCHNVATGLTTPSKFTILVVGDAALPGRLAFVKLTALFSSPLTSARVVGQNYRYTSGTDSLFITHNTLPGDWNVQLGTGNPLGSAVLVSAHDPLATCKVGAFTSSGARVRCFDGSGGGQDATFQVLQLSSGRPGQRFAYAWANQPAATLPYAPNPGYAYSSAGGPITVQRLQAGMYRVSFAGLRSASTTRREVVLVSAYGTAYSACTVRSWSGLPPDFLALDDFFHVNVVCSDASGTPTDSRFNVVVFE